MEDMSPAERLRIRIYEHEMVHMLKKLVQREHPEWFDGDELTQESVEAYVHEVSGRLEGIAKALRTAKGQDAQDRSEL